MSAQHILAILLRARVMNVTRGFWESKKNKNIKKTKESTESKK
jgi:hypothetical protein